MKSLGIAIGAAALLALSGCGESVPPTRGVYMLVDTSGTYTSEINGAQAVTNYLLATLNTGDSLVQCTACDRILFLQEEIRGALLKK